MKKLLAIVVLGLLFSGNVYAGDSTRIKKGSGPLKLDDEAVKFFHIYLTEKLTETSFEEKNLPGMVFSGGTKARYGNHFHIKGEDEPYIWIWWNDANIGAYEGPTFGCKNGACRQFASKNRIVWKGAKKKISRKITLDELKVVLKELGFYD
jgi:hypothetical protein